MILVKEGSKVWEIVCSTLIIRDKNKKYEIKTTVKEKINITDFSTVEKEILVLLDKNENCLYGNIFKELKLSQFKGAEAIFSLENRNVNTNIDKSSFYQLNGKIVK